MTLHLRKRVKCIRDQCLTMSLRRAYYAWTVPIAWIPQSHNHINIYKYIHIYILFYIVVYVKIILKKKFIQKKFKYKKKKFRHKTIISLKYLVYICRYQYLEICYVQCKPKPINLFFFNLKTLEEQCYLINSSRFLFQFLQFGQESSRGGQATGGGGHHRSAARSGCGDSQLAGH